MDRLKTIKDHFPDVLVDDRPNIITVQLNRPKALNSLSLSIAESMRKIVSENQNKWIVQIGSDRAFCAGADVLSLCERSDSAYEFFEQEYKAINEIAQHGHSIAIWKGIVMGGGLGISMPCKYRIATSSTVYAWPESVIGLVNDVGSNYWLSHMNNEALGYFLGIIGYRLNGADWLHQGIATHYVPDELIPTLIDQLNSITSMSDEHVARVLDLLHQDPGSNAGTLGAQLSEIERWFGKAESVQQIFERCSESEWGQKQLDVMQNLSPLSMELSFAAMTKGRTLSFQQVLCMEYDLVTHLVAKEVQNFKTGVTHKLINKRKDRPNWNPGSIDQVGSEQISRAFENSDGPWLTF